MSLCSATSRNVLKQRLRSQRNLTKNSLQANLLNAFNAERREIIQRGKKADVYSYGTFPTRLICLLRFNCLQKSLENDVSAGIVFVIEIRLERLRDAGQSLEQFQLQMQV